MLCSCPLIKALHIPWKGTEESTLGVDSSVPLMHHDPRDLGFDLFSKETKNPFSDSFGFKNPI